MVSSLEAPIAEAYREYTRRTPRSAQLWKAAEQVTPLGVHSNYRFIEPYPFYVRRARGTTLWDADDNAYLDFNMAFGALASGHAHPRIVEAIRAQAELGTVYGYEFERTPELADRLCRRFGMAKVRFSSTGLEATHHAVRVARARTGHRYVLKFEGGYHGSHDTLLVGVKPRAELAGPADRPHSAPAGAGILSEIAERTRVAPFNDLDATRAIAREFAKDVAAIIVEPIAMNMGFVVPDAEFLPGLRELANELGALLVFDEIKTGAKYPRGGAGRFGVQPDLMLLGKSIACGAPFSVIAGRSGILDGVGPGKVAHAGTFNANPMSVAVALASLDHVLTDEGFERMNRLSERLGKGYGEVFRDANVRAEVAFDGPSGTVAFARAPVRDWRSFLDVDVARWTLYFYECLNRGLIPGGTGPDEQWTLSVAHTEKDVDRHLETVSQVASKLRGEPRAGLIEEAV
jgi:glutamate-1-semialdehyde 2,1-aminomutase